MEKFVKGIGILNTIVIIGFLKREKAVKTEIMSMSFHQDAY